MADDIDKLINDLADKEPNVRWAAALSLGFAGDPRAVTALANALSDNYVHVRTNAVEALGKIGASGAVALCRALGDRSPSVARNAAKGLVKIGSGAVEPLSAVLIGARNEHVRQLAAIALGKIGDPQAIVALLTARDDHDEYVRGNAARALASIGDRDTLVRKILLSDAMTARSKANALNVLRKANIYPPGGRFRHDTSDALTYCRQMQNESDKCVREAALKMLRFLEHDDLVRASQRDETEDSNELIRSATGTTEPGEELLRSVQSPPSTTSEQPTVLRWLRRRRQEKY
jgi:HEAT repeat protein